MEESRKARAVEALKTSEYWIWITEWFLTFGSKAAWLLLSITTLYMGAELYPGVNLPAGLNLTVFLVQFFALDGGGMGLMVIARKAKRDGDVEAAKTAGTFGAWLLAIMITTLVTAGAHQFLLGIPAITTASPHAKTDNSIMAVYISPVIMAIEFVLTIARVVCAVVYGKVMHILKPISDALSPRAQKMIEDMQREHTTLVRSLNEKLVGLQKKLDEQRVAHENNLRQAQGNMATQQDEVNRLRASYEERLAQQEQAHRDERNRQAIAHASRIQEMQTKLNEQRTAPAQEKLKEVPRPKPQKPQEEEECIEGLFEYGKSVYQWNGETYYTKAEAATRWGLSPRQVETFTASHPEYALPLKERGDLKPRARLIRADALEKTKQAS